MDLSGDKSASSQSAGDARQMRRRDAFMLAMHQESNEGRKLCEECTVLLAASRGHLDGVLADGGKAGTSRGREAIEGMLKHVGNEAGGIMRSIDNMLDLSRNDRNALEETIKAYYKSF
jgi:F0F1-type ATP synthase alpha subunit